MERYSLIKSKNPREIVLLRGSGCKWKKCTFCDYHLDCSKNENENYEINKKALEKVRGIYGRLEVVNSGSFCDLDSKTIALIIKICKDNNISIVHFETHYIHRKEVNSLKELFNRENITVKIKTGVETFDVHYREKIMKKGFGYALPREISDYADEVCLLFGLGGQTEKSMINDIETGLKHFERVCINIMNENSTDVKPDNDVIELFKEKIAPKYIDNHRVDILINNTDFGVGAPDEDREEEK
ncbi:MAG: radical SAM protein [Oscillospiraceae bacterium]|nr:radical SAM protein [Oscillospiraceae bacterium]